MESICLIDFGDHERHGYIIGTRVAESLPEFPKYLDVGFNRQSVGWRDEIPHLHSKSDEFFFMLRGRIDLLINRKILSVEAGQLLGIRAGLFHQVINVRATIRDPIMELSS
jgi:uncharacterized cupin superfamily protein